MLGEFGQGLQGKERRISHLIAAALWFTRERGADKKMWSKAVFTFLSVASESKSNEDGDSGSAFFSGELNHEEGDKEDGEDDDDPDIGNPPSGPPFSVGVIVVSDGKEMCSMYFCIRNNT